MKEVLIYGMVADGSVAGRPGMRDAFTAVSTALLRMADQIEALPAGPDSQRFNWAAANLLIAGTELGRLQQGLSVSAPMDGNRKLEDNRVRIDQVDRAAGELIEAFSNIGKDLDFLQQIEPDEDTRMRFTQAFSYFARDMQRNLLGATVAAEDKDMNPTLP